MKNLFVLLFLFLPLTAFADHNNNHNLELATTVVIVDSDEDNSMYHLQDGIALGLASAGINFDMGIESLQWGLGFGSHDGRGATAFGLAKRLNGDGLLLSGKFSVKDDIRGYSIGLSGRFR